MLAIVTMTPDSHAQGLVDFTTFMSLFCAFWSKPMSRTMSPVYNSVVCASSNLLGDVVVVLVVAAVATASLLATTIHLFFVLIV